MHNSLAIIHENGPKVGSSSQNRPVLAISHLKLAFLTSPFLKWPLTGPLKGVLKGDLKEV